jgi:GT2 family glycosyltransferase
MPKQPSVTILILNWNGYNDTLALLENLESVTYTNFSVSVIDNGSSDESVNHIAKYIEDHRKNPRYQLSILPLSQNFGFAEGNNKGLAQAARTKPDYFLLLNNDTIVAPDFLNKMIDAALSDEKVGAVAPTIYWATPEGKKQDEIWFAGSWINFFAGGAHHLTDKPADAEPVPMPFLSGCCLLLKSEAVAKLKELFDPKFFAYGEDVDLSFRIQQKNFKTMYAPSAKIWHKLASSSGGPKSSNFWYYNVRNNFLIMSRYAEWYHWPIFLLYFFFYKPVLLSLGGAILKPRPDKWRRLAAIASGTIDAIIGRFGKRGAAQ